MSLKRSIVGDIDARILPGLLTWYRAETMREHFGDGEDLLYLFDESGNGRNMSSAESGNNKPPSFVSAGPNGYASMSFDGTDDELRGNLTGVAKGAFAVVKNSTSGNWGTDSSNFIGGIDAADFIFVGSGGSQNINIAGGATPTMYVNGVQTAAVANTEEWNLLYGEFSATDTITGNIQIGRVDGTGAFFSGEIAECGLFTGTPTSAQRTAFFNALIAKYNITG